MPVGRLRNGRVGAFCYVRGYRRQLARRTAVSPANLDAVRILTLACLAGVMLAGLRVVYWRSCRCFHSGFVHAWLWFPSQEKP